ncbi:MAG: hypothetical protein Q8O12_06595 [Candidatus Omnitrophota bacterium]|nr:hypothetical protein [Candidatus Omnitrophota bacterium]
MKNMILFISLCLIFSGCVTGAKTVKSSPVQQINPPVTMEQSSPMVIEPIGPVREIIQEPVRIQYSQITKLISNLINIEEKISSEGENEYLGISDNKLTVLEIKGSKDDIKEASMKLMYPKGIDKASAELNNAMMARFLKNAAPELQDWDTRVKDMLVKFDSLETGINGITKEDIALTNKIIQILYDKNANYIMVTLKPQP